MELCSEALEAAVTSEEAQPLFEAAAAKFQEVVLSCLRLTLDRWHKIPIASLHPSFDLTLRHPCVVILERHVLGLEVLPRGLNCITSSGSFSSKLGSSNWYLFILGCLGTVQLGKCLYVRCTEEDAY